MATKKKPTPTPRKVADKAPKPTRRGGRRDGAGRVAADGATGIITNSIGLQKKHMDYLDRQVGGKSAFIRKFVDKMIDLEDKKKARAQA